MHTTTATPFTICQRAAWATMRALAGAAAWAIGTRRKVDRYSLTDEECEAEGQLQGITRPCIFVGSLVAAPWWRLGAWDDGEGCFHLRAFGLWAEVHHSACHGVRNRPIAGRVPGE